VTVPQQQQKSPVAHKQQNKNTKTEEPNISKHLNIYSDGGARGNPGPAAIAYIIQTETSQTLTKDSQFIGVHTNNQAEYEALTAALETATKLKPTSVTCHLDSELVTKQLNGKYKVKNNELKQLWQKVQELKTQFTQIKFINVPRTNPIIQQADKLVNTALDAETE
jgi:ribonuclease HI